MDVTAGRANQRRRTRKALLEAAARLMAGGATPTLEDVAEAALVSRATAYRYFSGADELLLEASFDVSTPRGEEVFAGAPPDDPVARMERLDAAFERMIAANEPALRATLANAVARSAQGKTRPDVPARQNRRSPLIAEALRPAANGFDEEALDLLQKALALVIGPESMIVFKDVLQLGPRDASRARRWAIRALIEAARRR